MKTCWSGPAAPHCSKAVAKERLVGAHRMGGDRRAAGRALSGELHAGHSEARGGPTGSSRALCRRERRGGSRLLD